MSLRLVVAMMVLMSALALGGIAWRATQPAPVVVAAHTAPPPPLMLKYLVAAHAVPAGTLARDEDYADRSVPARRLPRHAIIDTPAARGALRGALVRHYIDAGAPITEADVLRPRDRGFLAAVLAPGTRALSIGVDAVSGVAGLIWPGDRVDVILTQQVGRGGQERQMVAETVLRDVRVIAVDQVIVQGASPLASAAGKLARTVTLQVNGADAERLAVAQRLGRLELAIRAAADAVTAAKNGASAVYGADVSAALADTRETQQGRMLVIQGGQRSEVTFR
ncbi:MAG: Flp pilus assembly protein CpaB [Rhodospirillales bacterium]|nr:Flp pilus assembly protein CpaB [Rhodospirillales bacterium]